MSDEMIAHVLTDGDCLEEFHRAMERYGVTRSQLCALIGLDQLEAFLSAPFPKDASLESAGCISPEHLYRLTVFVLTFGSLMGE